MMVIGIAILSGFLLPSMPNGTALRTMFGIVAFLLGVLRFFAARSVRPESEDRRRFGGPRKRPWENR